MDIKSMYKQRLNEYDMKLKRCLERKFNIKCYLY